MSWISKQITGLPAPEVILHIGAGACTELPHWQRAGAQRIVLVEPNPELLPELRRRTQGMEQVEIIEAAVAPEAGRGNLLLFNFPLLNSLREPSGLEQVLPGIRELGQATVDLLTMQDLLENVGMEEDQDNWLVLDAPGQEAEILEQIEQSDQLRAFSRILLTAGSDELYKRAVPAETLLARMNDYGFERAGGTDRSDTDWPREHLAFQPLALECRELKALLQEVENRADKAEAVKAKMEEAHKAELEKLQPQLSAARNVKKEAAQAEQALKEERSVRETLQAQLKAKSAEADNLKKSLAEMKSAKFHYEKLANEQTVQLEEWQQQQKKLDERQTLLDTEMERAEAQIDLIKDVLIREKNF